MAHFQRDKTTDEFGNPIRPTHEDPLHHGTIGTGPHGTASTGGGVTSVPLHRRSDSSSSSEDDGFGGRRKKKGLKEKIKEKLPGLQDKSDDPYGGASAAPYGGGQHEEKGMMDKIKEKLPGHH